MSIRKLLCMFISSVLLLSSCGTEETTIDTTTSNRTSIELSDPIEKQRDEVTSETATEPTETETTAVTTESTPEITAEQTTEATTTAHETVHYIKQIEIIDGVLPDGEYMINVKQPDEDYTGANFYVRGIWSISEEEYNSLEIGDTVFLGDMAYTYQQEGYRYVLCRDAEWGEDLLEAGQGYLMDGYEGWVYRTYAISENYHMLLDANCNISGDGVSYESLSDLWQDTIDNRVFCMRKGYHYYTADGQELPYTDDIEIVSVEALAIIKDNKVVSMWLNPEEHELWMVPELYEQKYGSLKNREGSILSYSSDVEYPDYEIKWLSDEGLRYAINEIWARHGYIFRNQEILDYYKQFDWYVETVPADEWDKNGQNFYLNSVEQKNIEKLVRERDRRS